MKKMLVGMTLAMCSVVNAQNKFDAIVWDNNVPYTNKQARRDYSFIDDNHRTYSVVRDSDFRTNLYWRVTVCYGDGLNFSVRFIKSVEQTEPLFSISIIQVDLPVDDKKNYPNRYENVIMNLSGEDYKIKAYTGTGSISISGKEFLPTGKDADYILGKDALKLRCMCDNGKEKEFVFDISGIRKLLKTMSKEAEKYDEKFEIKFRRYNWG